MRDIVDDSTDTHFASLGYMVLIQHPATLLRKTFYTLYLHMPQQPLVDLNAPVDGGETLIGRVGKTGVALGCHTHFEIRYFEQRFSKWDNIYGTGDQRESRYFKDNWEDPELYFERFPNGLTDVTL